MQQRFMRQTPESFMFLGGKGRFELVYGDELAHSMGTAGLAVHAKICTCVPSLEILLNITENLASLLLACVKCAAVLDAPHQQRCEGS
jgi:hypothetical protein